MRHIYITICLTHKVFVRLMSFLAVQCLDIDKKIFMYGDGFLSTFFIRTYMAERNCLAGNHVPVLEYLWGSVFYIQVKYL